MTDRDEQDRRGPDAGGSRWDRDSRGRRRMTSRGAQPGPAPRGLRDERRADRPHHDEGYDRYDDRMPRGDGYDRPPATTGTTSARAATRDTPTPSTTDPPRDGAARAGDRSARS
ncbi:hypothetical protein I6I18_02020 [Kytococcus sedentarius]|uniref:hypothetical protein n=1 Tax=Kytococcus sedentarius TaxID=1276 RepID=UPI0018E17C74|nr:hypothetical protein [Kytococcus sedentarius]QQB64294.1 hypothetical protein I6I18_02020 [Kytococcus sedentarius]